VIILGDRSLTRIFKKTGTTDETSREWNFNTLLKKSGHNNNRYTIGTMSLRKSSLKECIFDNMARYLECLINKNTLLQTVSLAILPTG